MHCADDAESLQVSGESGTTEGSLIMVMLSPCKGKSHCKSSDEIDEFLRTQILMLNFVYNQQEYVREAYEPKEEMIQKFVQQ